MNKKVLFDGSGNNNDLVGIVDSKRPAKSSGFNASTDLWSMRRSGNNQKLLPPTKSIHNHSVANSRDKIAVRKSYDMVRTSIGSNGIITNGIDCLPTNPSREQ